MTIAVMNDKGGVGKTPISFNLARDFDLNIQTNDHSALELVYKDRTVVTNDLNIANNTVYDLGGFAAHGVNTIVANVDVVIVPVFNDYSALSQTIATLKQLKNPKHVVIAVTRTENKDFKNVKKVLNEEFDGLTYFEFPLTKAFKNSIEYGKSIIELVKNDKQMANWYMQYTKRYIYPFNKYIKKVVKNG